MRLGIFGGSFDPVHYGHLLLAECCREACQLDEVWFMPAHQPPHKQQRTLTDPRRRLEMLQLAIAGNPAFQVSNLELERGGVSYTVDTLRQVHERYPDAELFLLLGADSMAELPTWREAESVCRLARLAVVCRPGQIVDWTPLQAMLGEASRSVLHVQLVPMPQVEFSSSDIRARVAAGRSIRYRTPRAVELYIRQHGLYRSENTSKPREEH